MQTLKIHGITDLYHDIMIQLANVSQTVGGQLARAEALVVLATIHPRVYGKMKACARGYGG